MNDNATILAVAAAVGGLVSAIRKQYPQIDGVWVLILSVVLSIGASLASHWGDWHAVARTAFVVFAINFGGSQAILYGAKKMREADK